MSDFSQVLQHGAVHAWLYVPLFILLGALHGLEPGHSKTMMAAFIIAIRGTVAQAVLLGLSAAISHSLIIWILAAVALKFGGSWNAETTEPYFQIASAVIVTCLALWMFLRTRRDLIAAASHDHDHGDQGHSHDDGHHHDHGHTHNHDHSHDESKIINTDHGTIHLSVFETGVPPVFRLTFSGHGKQIVPDPSTVTIETLRPGGERQTFTFAAKEAFLESTSDIPEPHEFDLALTVSHGGHAHTYKEEFREHGHTHESNPTQAELPGFQDAHELAHARDIEERFANRQVTTPQIILFGLTGGLLPCPAAFTVLLVCLQVKQFTIGFAMVGAFSLGLAITMVSFGAIAALGFRHAEKRFSGLGELMRKAPYISCAVLLILASYLAWQGIHGLAGRH